MVILTGLAEVGSLSFPVVSSAFFSVVAVVLSEVLFSVPVGLPQLASTEMINTSETGREQFHSSQICVLLPQKRLISGGHHKNSLIS